MFTKIKLIVYKRKECYHATKTGVYSRETDFVGLIYLNLEGTL